uniref:RRM domain-containing protein n=1 Tax=Parascaris equorum TaxID=6256 RepID=A0A914RM13_PAREQ
SPVTSIVPPLTNLFEGVPIFLIPQNGVGPTTVPLAAIQKAAVRIKSELGDAKSNAESRHKHEAKVIRDPQTMKSKGYGFSAEKAIAGMNGQLIGRRQIRTNWASRKPASAEEAHTKEQTFDEVFNATRADNTSVYVGNVHSSTTEEDLRDAFASIGAISEVRIFKQQGYAFVPGDEHQTKIVYVDCECKKLMANQAALNGLSLVVAYDKLCATHLRRH